MEKKLSSYQLKNIRKKLQELNSTEIHLFKFPEKIREKLVLALKQYDVEKLAVHLNLEISVLNLWAQQLNQVENILQKRSLSAADKKTGKIWQWTPLPIKKEILSLKGYVPVSTLANVFGLSIGAIYKWDKELSGKTELSSPDGIAKREETSILTSKDGADLEALIHRHKGKIRRKYSPSERRLILALVDRFGSKKVHETFHVSYDTIARLQRKSVMDLTHTPRIPLRYAPVVEIMDKYPGMGPMQIRDYVSRHLGKSMGVNSVRKVMEDNGWVPPYAKNVIVNDDVRRFEAVRRNYMWHMDFKHHYINKFKAYLLFVEDDYSRFIVGHTFSDGEKMDVVIGLVEDCIRIHGKPEMIMYDGGTAFHSWKGMSEFARYLEDYGIDRYVVKSANVNGKIG